MTERLAGNWFQGFGLWTRESEASDQYLWWSAAAVLSAATRRRIYAMWGYKPLYPNMYIMLVGEPGARKTLASDFAYEFAHAIELPIAAEATSKEGLIYNMVKNTVMQTMGDSIYDTSPMFIVSSDFMSFYRTSKEAIVEWLTDMYDTTRYDNGWTYEVRSRPVEIIPKPYLVFLGCTTPSWMAQNLGEVFTEQGFAARTVHVYAHGPRFKNADPKITPEMWDMRQRLIADLNTITNLSGEVKITEDAKAWFKHWYVDVHEKDKTKIDYRLRHYSTRKPVHLRKLAILISISDSNKMMIETRHMETALAQLDAIEPLMLRAFSSVGRNPVANPQRMLNEEIAARGTMKKSEIISLLGSDLGLTQIDEAIQALILMKKIAPVASDGHGEFVYRLTGKQP